MSLGSVLLLPRGNDTKCVGLGFSLHRLPRDQRPTHTHSAAASAAIISQEMTVRPLAWKREKGKKFKRAARRPQGFKTGEYKRQKGDLQSSHREVFVRKG